MECEKVKQILTFYKNIDNEVSFTQGLIEELNQYYEPESGDGMDGQPRAKYKKTNPTQTAALNIPVYASGDIREYEVEIETLYRLKKAIMAEINKLPSPYKNVIYDFYVQGLQWVQIAERIHYSATQCKNFRNRGLEKLGRHFSQNDIILKYHFPA